MTKDNPEPGSPEYQAQCREIGLERVVRDGAFRANYPGLDAAWRWARDELNRIVLAAGRRND